MAKDTVEQIAHASPGGSAGDARALREAFRTNRGLYMTCRRGIVLTSFGAGACMMIIGLYQMGITRRLRDPDLPGLDSSRVAAVPPVYRPFGVPIPDSLLGLVSYALTAALAGLGGPDRHRGSPALVFLMAAKVFADAILAGVLFGVQWAWYRAFCVYCVATSCLSLVAAVLAIPETKAASKAVRLADRRSTSCEDLRPS